MRNPNSVRPWQHVLEPLLGYLLIAEKNYYKKLKNVKQNWNFGPNLSSCKTVKYVAKKFSEDLGIGIKISKKNYKSNKIETNLLRLSNYKSKKFIQWKPRWSLNKSIKKIIEWNKSNKKNKKHVCEKQIKEFMR